MNWFQSEVLNGTDPETCSPAIFLYPQSSGRGQPRNNYIRLELHLCAVDLCALIHCGSQPANPALRFQRWKNRDAR